MAVLYASDYGFSDRLSQTLARGITKAGVATDMVDLLSADPQVRPGRARAPRLAPGCSATQSSPLGRRAHSVSACWVQHTCLSYNWSSPVLGGSTCSRPS